MAKLNVKTHVPLPEKEALSLLLKVKPTAEMPQEEPTPPKGKKPPQRKR